jgi:hypothetical protein
MSVAGRGEEEMHMTKKLFLIGGLLMAAVLSAQGQDISLGGIDFPQAYVHAGTEYPKGNYAVVLTFKDDVPYFCVYNSEQGLLFEELAIVKARPGGRKSGPFSVRKGIVKDAEYFRIMVVRPDQWLMGYFLAKK